MNKKLTYHRINNMPEIKVALCEDNEDFRDSLLQFIDDTPGYRVTASLCSAETILDVIASEEPDVVLMDLRMPGQDRIEAEHVREQLSHSCLLAMSFANDPETKNLAKAYGAVKLLDKINLASTLLPAIEECMRDNRKAQHA